MLVQDSNARPLGFLLTSSLYRFKLTKCPKAEKLHVCKLYSSTNGTGLTKQYPTTGKVLAFIKPFHQASTPPAIVLLHPLSSTPIRSKHLGSKEDRRPHTHSSPPSTSVLLEPPSSVLPASRCERARARVTAAGMLELGPGGWGDSRRRRRQVGEERVLGGGGARRSFAPLRKSIRRPLTPQVQVICFET